MGSDQNEFGEFLRQRRGDRTQADYASLLGIDASYYSRIERGERPPHDLLCLRIARVENLPADFVLSKAGLPLLGETDETAYEQDIETIRISLKRFKTPQAKARAVSAALAVLDSLAETESKDQRSKADPSRASTRHAAAG